MPHSLDQHAADGGVHVMPDGTLRIDALASLASLASHPVVRARYAALALACDCRDADRTLGDDLAQRGRCRYLQEGAHCLKNGGNTCLAVDGENAQLAIVEGGPSWIIHPSDAGVALVALEATIEIHGTAGVRTVPASDFFVLPTRRLDAETVLTGDERVAFVHLPGGSAEGVQRFTTARGDDSLVLVSLAAVRRLDGEVRLVLGRVSPRPYRIYNSIEEETTSGGLDDETIEGLAQRAMLDAAPLSENGYKLELAEGLLRDAIRALSVDT